MVCGSLRVVCCFLSVVCWLLDGVWCSLFSSPFFLFFLVCVCCGLIVARCLLFVVDVCCSFFKTGVD